MGNIMHNTTQPNGKTPLECAKAYGDDSTCLSILVVCYAKVGGKIQNVGDGQSKSPIC
jgi:hypothetical protein